MSTPLPFYILHRSITLTIVCFYLILDTLFPRAIAYIVQFAVYDTLL